MKIGWSLETGGSVRYIEVPDDELSWCQTREEQDELISDYVLHDFAIIVEPVWDRKQLERIPEPKS
jgi:hypothetical protein